LNPCGYSPYVLSSLTRGWVCRLQLLLALASNNFIFYYIILYLVTPNNFSARPRKQDPVSPVASITVAARTCLPVRCLETGCLTPLCIYLLRSNGCTSYIRYVVCLEVFA
jgi:hypothetical protein